MIRQLWQDIRAIDTSPRALRLFGILVGGVFLVAGACVYLFADAQMVAAVLGAVGAVLLCGGFYFAPRLRAVYRAWMALALVLGHLVTMVLLTVVYFLLITPLGLLMRLFGRDPMRRSFKPPGESYWIARRDDQAPERLTKYY